MAYTTIDDPSAYFQAFLYTGNGANRTITLPGNSDLKFDMYWYKQRSQTGHHRMFDTSRGLSLELYPDLNAGDSAATYFNNQQANSFDIIAHDSATNTGNVTFANWQWKCNGGTTSSNTDGTITSTVQVNQDAGFSMVTFTAPSSGTFSAGHGLSEAPSMIMLKGRDSTATEWWTWHKGLTGGTSNSTYVLALERTDAQASYTTAWGTTGVTSTVFGSQSGNTAIANNNYIAYCWAEKQGYSKFGKYVGNGNVNGTFVYTGFKPAFVMIKAATTAGQNWLVQDSKRPAYNRTSGRLFANTSGAENTDTELPDFLSNGFKVRSTSYGTNKSGETYIYMAFAENPFVTSTGVPTTAR